VTTAWLLWVNFFTLSPATCQVRIERNTLFFCNNCILYSEEGRHILKVKIDPGHAISQAVTSLSLRKPGRSMWDLWTKWRWNRFFSCGLQFSHQYHSTITLHSHVSPGGWTIGMLVATVRTVSHHEHEQEHRPEDKQANKKFEFELIHSNIFAGACLINTFSFYLYKLLFSRIFNNHLIIFLYEGYCANPATCISSLHHILFCSWSILNFLNLTCEGGIAHGGNLKLL
jgi:hypothetical protein